MGLIHAAVNAASGTLSDQWLEYFYCDALPVDVLVRKGSKKTNKRSSNRHGNDNVISNGSVISVADGQCMMIVDNGKVIDVCAEPGTYTYDVSSEPSLFYGDLSDNIEAVFDSLKDRIKFGGQPGKDQRIYYFNTREIIGNKYGTPSPVPFRIVDTRAGIDIDIGIRCFGEYSYKLVNPILFYTNVCGNVESDFTRSQLDSQMKSELLTALQPAFSRISEQGVRYSALPGHTNELAEALKTELSSKWTQYRGIEIQSIGVSSVRANEEDEKMIKELQRNAAFTSPNMAAAQMVGASSDAMKNAAANQGGSAIGFMNMNMAQQAGGVNAQSLFQMGASQNNAAKASSAAHSVKKPGEWFCPNCGVKNSGKFCTECGTPRPASGKADAAHTYKCSNCGWIPEDPTRPPKFCPNCGDPFNEEDILS